MLLKTFTCYRKPANRKAKALMREVAAMLVKSRDVWGVVSTNGLQCDEDGSVVQKYRTL